jgi:hypothetical protein
LIFELKSGLININKGEKDKEKDILFINNYFEKNDDELIENYKRCINCDIPRTFPKEKIMKNSDFIKNVHNILVEIIRIDKKLGYVQGINFIISYALMISGNNELVCLTLFFSMINLKSNLFPDLILKGIFYFIFRDIYRRIYIT